MAKKKKTKESEVTVQAQPVNPILTTEYKYRRDQCMMCAELPIIEAKWANGMCHSWFCDVHYKEWEEKNANYVEYIKKIINNEASKSFYDNPNPNIKGTETSFAVRFIMYRNDDTSYWHIILDAGQHIASDDNPLEKDEISFYFKQHPGLRQLCELIDFGTVTILMDRELIKKYDFRGNKMVGIYEATADSKDSPFWTLKKVEVPKENKDA